MMELQSEQINEIAAAMVDVQKEMRPAVKGADNPYFKSKYADLGEIWQACHDALSANGVAVIQGSRLVDGFPCMETKLVHSSGQWISSLWQMTPVKPDPQSMGSAITYMRRYSLAAMVGVITADDDGEAAMGRDPAQMERNRQRADDNAAKQVGKYLDKQEGPHRIDVPSMEDEKIRWQTWATTLKRSLLASTAPEEVDDWWAKNEVPLGNLKTHSEAAYDYLHGVAESRKEQIAAETGLADDRALLHETDAG